MSEATNKPTSQILKVKPEGEEGVIEATYAIEEFNQEEDGGDGSLTLNLVEGKPSPAQPKEIEVQFADGQIQHKTDNFMLVRFE